jgi:hypothetical protein
MQDQVLALLKERNIVEATRYVLNCSLADASLEYLRTVDSTAAAAWS